MSVAKDLSRRWTDMVHLHGKASYIGPKKVFCTILGKGTLPTIFCFVSSSKQLIR